jgi:hypothetical protein
MRNGVYVVRVMYDCNSARTHAEVLIIFIIICEPGLFLDGVRMGSRWVTVISASVISSILISDVHG